MRRTFLIPLIGCLLLSASLFWGCKDDGPTTPPAPSRLDIRLVANSKFTYKRTELDSLNQKVASTEHDYTVTLKGNGGLVLGAYTDWFYRIGTDSQTNEKDTLFIRTNTATVGESSFTKEVQVYGYVYEVLQSVSDLISASFGIPGPSIPGPKWDIIAQYYDSEGNGYSIGKEWSIGSDIGQDLSFVISGFPITLNVKIKGKLEAKDEKITVGSKQVNTWKSSTTITVSGLGSTLGTLKVIMWFSDDPDGQIKVLQESGKFVIPIINITLPVEGEVQELVSYQ